MRRPQRSSGLISRPPQRGCYILYPTFQDSTKANQDSDAWQSKPEHGHCSPGKTIHRMRLDSVLFADGFDPKGFAWRPTPADKANTRSTCGPARSRPGWTVAKSGIENNLSLIAEASCLSRIDAYVIATRLSRCSVLQRVALNQNTVHLDRTHAGCAPIESFHLHR